MRATSAADSRTSRPTSALDVDRVAAQGHRGHLRAVAGAVGGLLEHEGHAPALEHRGRWPGRLGQRQHGRQPVGPQVVDVQHMTGRRPCRPACRQARCPRRCRGRRPDRGRRQPGQDPAHRGERPVDLGVGDQQRRGEPEHVGPRGVDDQPGLERRRHRPRTATASVQHGGQQQALAPHVRRRAGAPARPGAGPRPPRPGPGRPPPP